MIRIIIADDHAVMRAGLRELLGQRGSVTVVGEAADGDAAIAMAGTVPADLMLLDVSMPGPPFLDVLQRVRACAPDLRVLVLTMHPEDQFAARALRAGASGYLTKARTPDELLEAVTRISRGGRFVSASLAERLASQLDGNFVAAPHERLSDREMEVLLLLGAGNTVKQAAAALRLSVKTVSTFRSRLLRKMQFASNADIVQYVARMGLLRMDQA
ncbi:MAG TPA: response regulator transcription factor [Gemmatimonadaceae bacterium]|nr:response regulator transcription factor [Gemmatimonadaceae bacterium]